MMPVTSESFKHSIVKPKSIKQHISITNLIKKFPSVNFKYINFPRKRRLQQNHYFPNCEKSSNCFVLPL